jgi:hypothetical protein
LGGGPSSTRQTHTHKKYISILFRESPFSYYIPV